MKPKMSENLWVSSGGMEMEQCREMGRKWLLYTKSFTEYDLIFK